MNWTRSRRLALAAAALLAGQMILACASPSGGSFPVPQGQELTCGGLTYRVLGCQWAHRLEAAGESAVPTHNFLVVRLELTNAGTADLPAMWLPGLWLVGEHREVFLADPAGGRLAGALRGSPTAWRPTVKLSGLLVFDVPQALYWLQPEGCPAMGLGSWWPERFGD
jgi:hypothetical protein